MPTLTLIGGEAVFDLTATDYPASPPSMAALMAQLAITRVDDNWDAGDPINTHTVPAGAVIVGQGLVGPIVGNPVLDVSLSGTTVTVSSGLDDAEPGNAYYFCYQVPSA